MLIDNEKNIKVHQWITKYVEEGKIDIVTGYFTVGALAWLAKNINSKIEEFRFVLGDIASVETFNERTIDLLNENISIEAALKLSTLAKEAVAFLQQEKVLAKTLEPNFCHAKVYLFDPKSKDERDKFFITGSSNLTEAGIGLKVTQNVELNIAETGNNGQYKELGEWFKELWDKPQAHSQKTLTDEKGKKYKKDFKKYLIDEIERLFIQYTPKQLYYKVLFELFGEQLLLEQDNPEFNRQIGRLENTVVFNTLFDFQKKGVLSLIKMLQKYNGAILADAVGLGKTWSALAVMKFFQLQGREVILISPKKLQHNWRRYLRHQNSKFEKDNFDYFIRFHTDLGFDLLDKYNDRADKLFINDKPKLFVIDESHNLRNDKSNRYKFLINEILKKNEDAKVLMLSATPINNSLNDIRNQFKLIIKGSTGGFDETLNVKNIDYTFRTAQKSFNDWREHPTPRIADFIKTIPDNFFKLTDALIVARTRKMIEGQETGLEFPKKEKPDNIFITPKQIGNFESFEELFDHFPPTLSGYQPAFYAESKADKKKKAEAKKKGVTKGVSAIEDEQQRDKFLVKMMYILLVKRLESSWFSFSSTATKILAHHQNILEEIKQFLLVKKDIEKQNTIQTTIFEDDDVEDDLDSFSVGKKRTVKISDIFNAGMLDEYKKDLKKDIDCLQLLVSNVERFSLDIAKELNKTNNHKSDDDKLQVLIEKIKKKRKSSNNNDNQKVLIFTVYRDTANYLFDQLTARGFTKIAMVSGDGSRIDDMEGETKNFEPILERFSPFTKLFREKEWTFEPSSLGLSQQEQFDEWTEWIKEVDPKTYENLQNPIDILIATDTLSEGQNLQDCDMVVNYDIHWNPVRVIQRMGRIDRLGSPNSEIFGINFWPSNNINSYLNLQGRIEHRMTAMRLAGSEVHLEFSESFAEMASDENLENKSKARMMEQMQTTWDDIEVSDAGLGFDSLSLETYRQELLEQIKDPNNIYAKMPKAVYTGFVADKTLCPKNGIIALMGYPARPPKVQDHIYSNYDLIYIDTDGKEVVLNQKEVLDILTHHKNENRFVPDDIEKGEELAIKTLSDAIQKWLSNQAIEEQSEEGGATEKTMGKETKDILQKLKTGDKNAVDRVKQNIKVTDKYKAENFDLITWFIIN